MSIALAPTTELDAVNEMLASIGEAPVNTLTNTGLGDAAIAHNRLYDASRRTQKRGWSWNTDYKLTLAIASDGTVPLPPSTLRATFVGNSSDQGYTIRGTKVYDAVNHTFTFTVPPVADVVTMQDFSLLPESARQFIYIAAGIRFQAGFVGSDILYKFTTADAMQSWTDLLAEEAVTADWNVLTDSAFMQDALNRYSSGTAGLSDLGL